MRLQIKLRRFGWLTCAATLWALSCAPLAPDLVRPAVGADASHIVIIRSSANPLLDAPMRWFMDSVSAEVTVFTLGDASPTSVASAVRERQPNLIFALGSAATMLAQTEFSNVPLVFAMVVDYKRLGLGSRPQVAGIALESPVQSDFSQFKMVLPNLKRVLTFYSASSSALAQTAQEALKPLGIELVTVRVDAASGVPAAYTKNAAGIDAIWLLNDPALFSEQVFNFLKERSYQDHVPLLTALSDEFAEAGAFASVSVDFTSLGSQAANIANMVLKGRSPQDIGIQPPIGAYLAVNLDAAKRLGVEIPGQALPNINRVISSEVKETRVAQAASVEEEAKEPAPETKVETKPEVVVRPKREKPSERLVLFYDPDANHQAIVRITTWFTEFLRTIDPKMRLQPVPNLTTLEKMTVAGDAEFAIVPASYVQRKGKPVKLLPLLVPSANGSVFYRKALMVADGSPHPKVSTVAATLMDKKASRELLRALKEAGVEAEGTTIIPVSKDIDALLALSFRQVDAALVSPESLDLAKNINPAVVATLRKIYETKPRIRPPLCAVTDLVTADEQAAFAQAMKKMVANAAGKRAVRTLGFDTWVTYEPVMLKE